MDERTPSAAAAIESSGVTEADVVKVHATPVGMAVVTAASHAISDPGDAHPVAVQRGVACDWHARGEPAPELARSRG